MSGVDDRVVSMDFQNSRFERGVGVTLGTLDKLKKSLDFSGSKKGLDELQTTGNKFNLSGMGTTLEGVSGKLSSLGVIGVTALATIANKAINVGVTLAKSLTVAPLAAGFQNYETQINAVQTILANTGLTGKKGLDQVNTSLAQLNTYANQTVYNFSEMAKNIGTFTAAGVDLKTSTASIKGIANLAALSGSTSDQASSAMYQLSQAIAANQVKLQDWNSVVNAGLGGKVFQEALFNTGKALKTLKGVPLDQTFDQWTKAGNSFRGSLQSGWITGKVLTQTLEGFTGDLTDAQLKSMGYNQAQIKQIRTMGKTATDAATKIKTMSQLTSALKEEVATAWSAIFKTIFGDINQATTLFSAVHTSVENALTGPIYALNTLLEATAKLGGRTQLILAIKQGLADIGKVITPVKEAFREIFPAKTAKDLYTIIVSLKDFLGELEITTKTSNNLKRSFAGLFAIFDIARQIVHGFVGVFASLVGTVLGSTGSITAFTANLGDFFVALDKSLKEGGKLNDFFDKLAQILAIPLSILIAVGKAIFGLFDGFNQKDASDISDSVGRIGQRLDALNSGMQHVVDFFQRVKAKIQPGVDAVEKAFGSITQSIYKAFSGANFNGILDVVNTGLLGGLTILVRKFLKNGLSLDFSGGLIDKIKETFDGLTGTMKTMQTQLKASTLEKIAIAIGILTASVVALSLIDSARLTKALAALAVGFGELLLAMAILTKISGSAGFAKVPLIAASMILLSTAVLILTVALRNLSGLNWTQLAKGLAGIAGILLVLSVAVKPLSANSAGMIRVGIGITAIGVALNIMYLAVLAFSRLSWKELLHGLAGVAGILTAVALAIRLMPKGMVATGAGLIEIAVALNALYLAVRSFSSLNWTQMGKGLVGIGAGLIVIAGAMRLMPKGMIAQAAALDLIAVALLGIARAVAKMGALNWTQIGKGLGTMAGALLILAGALRLMQSSLSGAASLALAAAAITLLAGAIDKIGALSWKNIAKGLVGIAGALAIFVVAGLAAEAVAPGLLALSLAAIGLGAGFALAGFGVGALASGLSELADTGSKGIAVLLTAFTGFIAKLPALGLAMATAFVNVLKVIGENGPALTQGFIVIISSFLTAITVNIPKVGALMTSLITTMLGVITANAPQLIAAGLNLLIQLLDGIGNNIGRITTEVAVIIVQFLNALAAKADSITAAGLNLLVQFLTGIAKNIGRVVLAVGSIITSFIGAVANNVNRIVTAGANAIISFASGLGKNATRIIAAGVTAIGKFISGLGNQGVALASAAAQAILDFLDGLDEAIKTYEPQIIEAMFGVGEAMVEGIIRGLGNIGATITKKITGGLGGVVSNVKNFLHIGVPSMLFADEIGEPISLGIAKGIDNQAHVVNKSATDMIDGVVNNLSTSLSKLPGMLEGVVNLEPTISPVLDLSNVQKAAAQIPQILAPGEISPIASSNQAIFTARAITAQQQPAPTPIAVATDATPIKLEFTQNNTSPVALSPIEIYRSTRNLLSLTKEALDIS